MTPDVNVFIIDFKNTSSREVVTLNEDSTYSIFINSRLSREKQHQMYQHALKHIGENDFDRQDVQAIEAVAHEIRQPNSQPIPAKKFEETFNIQERHSPLPV